MHPERDEVELGAPARLGRRKFGTLAAAGAAATWVAPSVVGLDRVGAATPSSGTAFSYFEDFQSTIGNSDAAWSTTQTVTAPLDPSRRLLGEFDRTSVATLTLNLPVHTTLEVCFELVTIRSWDGVGDNFRVDIDGTNEFNESFAADFLNSGQFGTRRQSFGPNPTNPPATGASEINTLGFFWANLPADAVYEICIGPIPHTANIAEIDFFGVMRGRGGINDESWAIDNVQIHAC